MPAVMPMLNGLDMNAMPGQMPGGQMQTGPRKPRYNPDPNSGRMEAGPRDAMDRYKSPFVEGGPRFDQDPLSSLPPWGRMLLELLPDLMSIFRR